MDLNRCLTCGACCATFRVSFFSSEVDDHEGGIVPVDFSITISKTHSAMKGTNKFFSKRCIALEGVVGRKVNCRIYQLRPTTCRAFMAAWDKNFFNDTCNLARSRYGLPTFDYY